MKLTEQLPKIAILFATVALSSAPLWASSENDAALKAEAKVSEASAAQAALERVPGGQIMSSELEREHGRLIWSFDVSKPKSRKIAEIHVDAKTGKILAVETETPHQQAAEAASERK